VRFHLRTPGAEQNPQGSERKPRNSFGAKRSKDSQGSHWKQCDEDGAWAEPEPMRDGDSGGEEPRGMEQGNLRQFVA
jgi:hypothetical protein